MGTARYHKLIKSALCSCSPSSLVSGTVPSAERGREGPRCPPELPTDPCWRWDKSRELGGGSTPPSQAPLPKTLRLLPSICPFPSVAEATPLPTMPAARVPPAAGNGYHLPRTCSSPNPGGREARAPMSSVAWGARDTHVTKAADAAWSPASVTSAGANRCNSKAN